MLMGIAGSTSRLNCGFVAARLKSITLLVPPGSNAANIGSVEWTGGSRREQIVDNTGSNQYGRLYTRPSFGSLCAQWHSIEDTTNDVLCTIKAPTGTIIDIEYYATIIDGGGVPSTYVSTYSTLSAGAIYYPPLDSHGSNGAGSGGTNRYPASGMNAPA